MKVKRYFLDFYKNVTPSGVFFVMWIELCVIKI